MRNTHHILAVFLFIALLTTSVAQNKEQKNEDKESKPLFQCKVEKPKGTPSPLNTKINVFVTDSRGKPVTDLKQENIKVFENDMPQTLTSFSKREGVNSNGIVIDSSGTMRNSIDKAVQAGQNLIHNKYEQDEFFVVEFSSSENIALMQDWTTDTDLLQKSIKGIGAVGGQTALIDALYLTFEKIIERQKTAKEPRRYGLILLSDGDDRRNSYSEKQMFDLLSNTGIQIFALGFIRDLTEGNRIKPVRFLSRLAHETGGDAIFLVEKGNKIKPELEAALKSFIYELRANYAVSYNSTNASRDGTRRKIRVEITDSNEKEKYFVFARDSYIAPCN